MIHCRGSVLRIPTLQVSGEYHAPGENSGAFMFLGVKYRKNRRDREEPSGPR